MSQFEAEIKKTKTYFSSARFKEITRLYSPRQVVEQRGTIKRDYSIAKKAADTFYKGSVCVLYWSPQSTVEIGHRCD